jgi:hypothetical protein
MINILNIFSYVMIKQVSKLTMEINDNTGEYYLYRSYEKNDLITSNQNFNQTYSVEEEVIEDNYIKFLFKDAPFMRIKERQ